MLPSRRSSSATRKGTLARAIERFRKVNAAKRGKGEPAAAQPLNEYHLIIRCAVTGRHFKIVFGRNTAGLYVPKSTPIEIEDQITQENIDAAPRTEIAVSEITWVPSDPCPYCGADLPYVKCGRCEDLICTGQSYYDQDGEFIFVCDEDCGGHGPIEGPISSYAIEPHEPRKALASPGKILLPRKGKP